MDKRQTQMILMMQALENKLENGKIVGTSLRAAGHIFKKESVDPFPLPTYVRMQMDN